MQQQVPLQKIESSLKFLRLVGGQRSRCKKKLCVGHGISINSSPIVVLALTFGVFCAKQIGNRRQTRAVAVAQNPQTFRRLVDCGAGSLQREMSSLLLNMCLRHLQAYLMLIGSQLGINLLLNGAFSL